MQKFQLKFQSRSTERQNVKRGTVPIHTSSSALRNQGMAGATHEFEDMEWWVSELCELVALEDDTELARTKVIILVRILNIAYSSRGKRQGDPKTNVHTFTFGGRDSRGQEIKVSMVASGMGDMQLECGDDNQNVAIAEGRQEAMQRGGASKGFKKIGTTHLHAHSVHL